MKNQNKKIQELITASRSEIAEEIVNLQYAKNPEAWEKYGPAGKKLSIRDAGYHLPFLTEAIVSEDDSIFREYVTWVKKLFTGLNLPQDTMKVTLECTREVLQHYLSEEMAKTTNHFIESGLEQLKKEVTDDKPFINKADYLGEAAYQYINALLNGDRMQAGEIIMQTVESGKPVRDIYIHIFQKSQYEVGRLWLSNKITVAKEHFCSAATQQIMSQLYPYIFTTDRIGKTFVAACIGGELHEIGIRMVADFFEMEGWDTYYLGANSPTSSIVQAIEDKNANLLGLSVAMPYHRNLLREAIDEIRQETNNKIKIMVGGNAMNTHDDAWRNFRADAYAPDAIKAIEIAKQLLN